MAATPATTITAKKVARTRHKEIVAVFLLDDLLLAEEIEKKFYKCSGNYAEQKVKAEKDRLHSRKKCAKSAIRR